MGIGKVRFRWVLLFPKWGTLGRGLWQSVFYAIFHVTFAFFFGLGNIWSVRFREWGGGVNAVIEF